MKIATVVGARPQFVKAAVISRLISNYFTGLHETVIHTGQHYDPNMSNIFFSEMEIPQPAYCLNISGATHGAMTGAMLIKIEEIFSLEKPDIVLVYGDTNSTLAGSLAAAKMKIPLAHVEAGLRSFNMKMPEEINRILTDRISQWLFCPTQTAMHNLEQEGFFNGPQRPNVLQVGDVMYDAVIYYKDKINVSCHATNIIEKCGGTYYLATVHRAENTDNPERLKKIIDALDYVAGQTPVILPLHPRTRKVMEQVGIVASNVQIVDPVGYFDMLTLLEHCNMVLTDSGGLQKEAFFFHKPCVTFREETEWVELVQYGFNLLTGIETDSICKAVQNIEQNGEKMDFSISLFGDGNAGEKILNAIMKYCI